MALEPHPLVGLTPVDLASFGPDQRPDTTMSSNTMLGKRRLE